MKITLFPRLARRGRRMLGLQTRILLMITGLLAFAVFATAALLAWNTRRAILDQTAADGIQLAQLLARSAEFADQIADEVEDAVGEQMIVQATIAAHLIAIAEQAGRTPAQINNTLQQITDATVLDEIWITDETGHARFRTLDEVEFTFSPDSAVQPQAHVFWPLLTGERRAVVQEARRREIDPRVFKYAGVGGVDKPRIVEVGYEAVFLDQLRHRVGLVRLVDQLVSAGAVVAIRVVDRDFLTLAFSAVPAAPVREQLTEPERRLVDEVVRSGHTATMLEASVMTVIAPILSRDDARQVIGATLVQLPTDYAKRVMERELALAALVAAVVLLLGGVSSTLLARRITVPVLRLTEAAFQVEKESCNPSSLNDIAGRADELGELARVFQRMAFEVVLRERRLRQQVEELRIEIDQAKAARQVAEITETEYFQELRKRASQLRMLHAPAASTDPT